MHALLEGIVKLEIQLMLETFIEKMKYFSLFYLNTAIKTLNNTEEESTDKPQEIEMKSLRRPNTFPMTAIETKKFIELLFFSLALAGIIGVFEWRPKTVSLKTRSEKI